MESTKVSFTAKDVMALRRKTGLGMMDCKQALTEMSGDMAKAEEWLRAHRKGQMASRTERATGEGRIDAIVEGAAAVMVEVRTETDFAARNEAFVRMVASVTRAAFGQPAGEISASDEITRHIDEVRITTGENVNFARGVKIEGGTIGKYVHHDGKRGALVQVEGEAGADFLKGLCQHIVFYDPLGIDENDVPAEALQAIRSQALEDARTSGKPAEIAEKIAAGKVRKYLQERTLVHQKFVVDDSRQVKDVLPPGVVVKRFVRYTLGAD